MKKFSGIDLHSNNSVVVVTDEVDRIVYQQRLPNELPVILQALEPHRGELAGVVVESTYNWYWLVDGLKAAGYRVHLANTTAIKKYDGLKYSGDVADAEAICEAVGRPNRRFVPIKSVEQRAILSVHRVRQGIVKARTAQANQIRGLLGEFGLVIPQGIWNIAKRVLELLEDASNELPVPARHLIGK